MKAEYEGRLYNLFPTSLDGEPPEDWFALGDLSDVNSTDATHTSGDMYQRLRGEVGGTLEEEDVRVVPGDVVAARHVGGLRSILGTAGATARLGRHRPQCDLRRQHCQQTGDFLGFSLLVLIFMYFQCFYLYFLLDILKTVLI